MQKLCRLAEGFNAGVGGTRPSIYSGWLPVTQMVGLSGTIIAPKVCMTFGASGCTPLVKGIEQSEVLGALVPGG